MKDILEEALKILLVIPPFTQINTLYPSAGQLAGYLSRQGYETRSLDLSIKVTLRIFSGRGLEEIFSSCRDTHSVDPFVSRMLSLSDHYIDVIDPVISYLQGKNTNLAHRIVREGFLPHSESFSEIKEDAFGDFALQDKAKYYCSLLIDDLTRFINKTITPHFGLSRYAEKIAVSLAEFDALKKELNRLPNLIEQFIIEETDKIITEFNPQVIGYSIPFPGNLLGALVSSKYIKENFPDKLIVFGGGYVNTELRSLKDPEIFRYTDYITLDDGELPILNILRNMTRDEKMYVRTFTHVNGKVTLLDNAAEKNLQHDELYPPSMQGIDPDEYISMTEMLNPMHRLWSDGFWNKLAVAHGCYWKKCTFCDVTLDYIKRYSPARVETIVSWIEQLIEQTGRTSFHFTDEAAPPSLLKELSLEIIKRKLHITWWGNIRFEKSFTSDLCRLMAASGCIAVSGGLEIADERLLKLINKGVTIEQTAGVCSNFQNSGIMVHAYLMYGFPTQTEQEIVNSLELVRQFMELDLFQSAFWHRFSLTAHSPVAKDPEKYNVIIDPFEDNSFALNDLNYSDKSFVDYNKYAAGLNKALYNYMNRNGLNWHIKEWFDFQIPEPGIKRNYIMSSLKDKNNVKQGTRLIWLSGKPELKKNGTACKLLVHTNTVEGEWSISEPVGGWLVSLYQNTRKGEIPFALVQKSFPGTEDEFNKFLKSEVWKELRDNVIILV